MAKIKAGGVLKPLLNKYLKNQKTRTTFASKIVKYTLMSETEVKPIKKPRKKGSGGARPNSGPKTPVLDKKKTVAIYPRESWLKKLGGEIKVRDIAMKAVERALLETTNPNPENY